MRYQERSHGIIKAQCHVMLVHLPLGGEGARRADQLCLKSFFQRENVSIHHTSLRLWLKLNNVLQLTGKVNCRRSAILIVV